MYSGSVSVGMLLPAELGCLGTSVTKARQNSAVSLLLEESAVSHGTLLDPDEHTSSSCPQLPGSPWKVFALRETLAGLAPRQIYCPLLAGRGGTGSWPTADGQKLRRSWGIYWTGTHASQGCICASALTHRAENKQLKHRFLHLPSKPDLAAFHFSSPGQIHVTNSCSQWIININKAFNWNLIEKHFHQHSWQEPPRTNAVSLPSTA